MLSEVLYKTAYKFKPNSNFSTVKTIWFSSCTLYENVARNPLDSNIVTSIQVMAKTSEIAKCLDIIMPFTTHLKDDLQQLLHYCLSTEVPEVLGVFQTQVPSAVELRPRMEEQQPCEGAT